MKLNSITSLITEALFLKDIKHHPMSISEARVRSNLISGFRGLKMITSATIT